MLDHLRRRRPRRRRGLRRRRHHQRRRLLRDLRDRTWLDLHRRHTVGVLDHLRRRRPRRRRGLRRRRHHPGDGCSATCTVEPGWTCMGTTPSVCSTTCGDGIIAGAEACDDGNPASGDGCSATCAIEPGWTCTGAPSACVTTCGDGIPAGAETCDDGNTTAGDGCGATCATEPGWTCTGAPSACTTSCGDGVVAGAETCDDGNTTAGDGCDATCATEPGWTCTGAPSACTTTCGDGVVAGAEACDDGNTTADDGCSTTCAIEPGWSCTGAPSACSPNCGDGMVDGAETCDDGNTTADDGCSPTCQEEPGWTCDAAMPSVCTEDCGNGALDDNEACDDGNIAADDGCSPTCAVEVGWMCTGDPSVCGPICGDSMIIGGEACDDGNTAPLDGCGATCAIEDHWTCPTPGQPCEPDVSIAGGCSAGGGGGGLPLAAGLLLLGIVVRRRRGAATLAVLLALASTAAPAAAQVTGSSAYSAERFRLAMDRDGVLGAEAARAPGHLVLDIGLWLGYANDPITVRDTDPDHTRLGALVSGRVGGDLVASVGLGSRFELGLAAPVILSQSESLGMLSTSTGELSSLGFGDLSLTPKAALLRGSVDVAVAVAVTLPTSGGSDYLGEDGVTVAPALLVGRTAGPLRLLGNLGYRARKSAQMVDLAVDDELFARAGVGYQIGKADVMGELSFATQASDPFASYNITHAEARAGVGYDVTPGLRLFAATGAGLASGFGTPDWRALGGVFFGAGHGTPVAREVAKVVDTDGDGFLDDVDKCVTEPETVNSFEDDDGCPDNPDADGDGILVPADQCPDEPETVNSFEDDDGCPDAIPDADGDGLTDPNDSCPTEPEDVDGFEDDDGCPDADNDQDTVLDAVDRCPLEAGVVDNAGCPDTDRDGDTVVDRLDNCPDVPGSVKNQGCKDKQLVTITGGTIDTLEIIYFKTDKDIIQKRSYKLLTNVASVISGHSEIVRVTIEGHTDNFGDDAYNKDLSQRRAQAVADFLVGQGISADLLVPIGYGEERPIKDNSTKKGRARNRRVEFKLETGPAPATP
ncbi:MAG: DUF4215 domain-containing protein [Myxococcales bacterium]|nr:DUF4215 domain-containing protein [Myxococcales bacterium]